MDSDIIKYFNPKVKNRIREEKNRIWKFVDLDAISMLGYKSFEDAVSFKSRLQTMLGGYGSNLLNNISDKDRCAIIDSAEQGLMHEFDLLGSGPVTLNPIDWHLDFKNGTRWVKKYYREIGFINGSDIKVPWELSRCQHLLWLGEAFLLTREEKYAQEVLNEINWWIDDNPLMYSVNWKCAMDVAFRAVNWLFALNMISSYSGFDDIFAEKVGRGLWQHGFFIRNNLEKYVPYSNNHYTSDLVGLLYIGALFNETRKGRKWFQYGLKEFISEIRLQVLPSGVHYERSVSYHRMMVEMLSYPIYMLQRLNIKLPQEIMNRINLMYNYISNYSKPNGLSPLIGDNDDGRFVPFVRRDFRCHNYLLDTASAENIIVTIGLPPVFCIEQQKDKLYLDAGVAIFKRGLNYLFVNNGGYSRVCKNDQMIINTHTHNDALSFELSMNGKDIIVDPGTYLYTSSKIDRDAFRSTRKHNTVVVDEEEQNEFINSFYIKRNIKYGELKNDNGILNSQYMTLSTGLLHKRSFKLTNDGLTISDELRKAGSKHISVFYFHFANGLFPQILDESVVLNSGVSITFNKKPLNIDIIDDTLSPSYGVVVESKTLALTYLFDNDLLIETYITNK